jgi:N-acetylglucosamine-6-phosphate deacetylase
MEGMKAYTADRVFTGEAWLPGYTVLAEDGRIIDLAPSASLPGDMVPEKFPGSFIAPAFIDLQIYGAHRRLLAAYPERDSLFKLNDYCNKGGAAFCMPTVATNSKEIVLQCIDAVRDYWNHEGEGILGLHLEGPWINPLKRGAHIESLIHSPSVEEARELLDYGRGVIKIITLAPELCSREVIELILSDNILISAGHSNATYRQAIKSFDNGIPAVTHLYNAMSPLQHREPGLVGATMVHPAVMASIIPDGHHVDYAAIRIAKQVMKERLFVITDAVTHTDTGDYQHQFEEDKYTSSGILSGSALTMLKAVHNLVGYAGIDLAEALRMCSLYPARLIKMDDQLGRIAKNHSAKMVVVDESLKTSQLIS